MLYLLYLIFAFIEIQPKKEYLKNKVEMFGQILTVEINSEKQKINWMKKCIRNIVRNSILQKN